MSVCIHDRQWGHENCQGSLTPELLEEMVERGAQELYHQRGSMKGRPWEELEPFTRGFWRTDFKHALMAALGIKDEEE